jgi:hypothetical protein
MSTTDKSLETTLAEFAAGGGNDATVDLIITRIQRRARLRRGLTLFSAGAASAVLVAGATGLVTHTRDAAPSARPATRIAEDEGDFLQLNKAGEPCLGAKHVSTVGALRSAADAPVWAPSSLRLTDAWTCAGTPVLIAGKVQISYEPGWSDVDIQAKFASLAKELGGGVETALGRPALTVPAGPDGSLAMVMVVVEDTLVRLVGTDQTVTVDGLVSVARSIKLPPELAR